MADSSKIAGWTLTGGAIGILLWLIFSKRGKQILHERVTATIIPAQAATGIPQYDYNQENPAGVPVAPITDLADVNRGAPSYHPSRPDLASCPMGFILWHEISTDSYLCFPAGDAKLGGGQ